MSNQTSVQKSKLMIARDKFCDADFDRLVIDTSHSVARKCPEDGTVNPVTTGPSQNYNQAESRDLNTSTTNKSDHDRLNQPKRPMNAFMVWGQAIRRELHHKFSNVQNALLSKALGRVWRLLDPADKEPFIRKANMIKANHKRDYPNYRYQPRRVQERRAKNNMLIGINLNHPVNQHQCQQATYSSSDQTTSNRGTNHQFAHGSSEHQRQLVSEDSDWKLLMSSNWRRNLTVEPRARDLSKDTIDDVQTFEYHPYPSAVATTEITIECNNCRPITTNGCQDEVNCCESHIYPQCQQLTYNMQHQHHHQQQHYNNNLQHLPQQQEPFSYEIAQLQPNHMDSCHGSSLKTMSNAAGLYYGNR